MLKITKIDADMARNPFSFVFQTIYIYKEHTLTLYYCIQR